MTSVFPGPKTKAVLERGIPLFRNGLKYDVEMERAGRRGFRAVRQIVIDKALGDFVWDMDAGATSISKTAGQPIHSATPTPRS